MQIEVVYTVWGAEDVVFQGGIHELGADECACGVTHGKPDAELLRLIAGAEAAGSVNVLDYGDDERATLDAHVQSQEDGEAALTAAMGDWVPPVKDEETGVMLEPGYWTGGWHEGNLTQFILRLEDLLAADELAKNEPLEERVERIAPGEYIERQGLTDERIASIKQHLEDARVRLAAIGERS